MASPDSSPTPPAALPLRAPSASSPAEGGPAADYRILTPERVGLQYATAGIGSRSAAALVDSLLQFLFILLWGAVIYIAVISLPPVTRQRITTTGTVTAVTWIFVGVFLVGFFLILFAYFVLFEILWNGQTPGKRMLGLRVIRENGYPLRAVDAVVRNLVRIVDALPTG